MNQYVLKNCPNNIGNYFKNNLLTYGTTGIKFFEAFELIEITFSYFKLRKVR